MSECLATSRELIKIFEPNRFKRTGEDAQRWYDFPIPHYLYTDRSGVDVREGDEVVGFGQDQTSNFQICQSCQGTCPLDRLTNICPHCGFDVDKAIAEQEEMNRIDEQLKQAPAVCERIKSQLMYLILSSKITEHNSPESVQ